MNEVLKFLTVVVIAFTINNVADKISTVVKNPRTLDSIDKVSTNLKKIDVHDVELFHIDCVGICLKS
jgi:hypothetical protein